MVKTISELIRKRGLGILGRERELRTLDGLVTQDGPVVAYIHGAQGIGKSALLAAFASRVSGDFSLIVHIDAGSVEPRPEAIVAALSDHCGDQIETISALVATFDRAQGRVLLAIDDLDHWRLAATWLRQDLLPALPQNVRIVLAGRSRPPVAWKLYYGSLLIELPLGSLKRASVVAASSAAGLNIVDAERVWELTNGHPFGMTMAISAAQAGMLSTVKDAGELANAILHALDEAPLREVVEAIAIVRRASYALVSAILDQTEEIPSTLMEKIEALPFVLRDAEGVYLAEPVRRAMAEWMLAMEPERHALWRARAVAWITDRLKCAGPSGRWRYMADLLHLLDQPALRDAFFPPDAPAPPVEPARPEDVPAILTLAEKQDGPDERGRIEAWLNRLPHRFSVARGPEGEVLAAYAYARPNDPLVGIAAIDPLFAAWNRHLANHPTSGEILFVRLMTSEMPDEMTPGRVACILDLKRCYIERWGLSRIYSYVGGSPVLAPIMLRLGFRPLETGRKDIPTSLVLDLPGADLIGWVAELVRGPKEPASLRDDAALIYEFGNCRLDMGRRELTRDGVQVQIERQVFNLLAYFAESGGRVVSKDELLSEIWDGRAVSDDALTSRIKAARRAIGDDGRSQRLIKTVHRIGYQFLG